MAEEILRENEIGCEKMIHVACRSCETTIDFPISKFRYISTDQGAGFLAIPEFQCEKCHLPCQVEIPR